MHTLESLDCEAASLFNAQKHFDEVKSGFEASALHDNEMFTYMLRHKHFDLVPGEVLWVDKVENGYNTHVKKRNGLGDDAAHCMWIHKDGWKAFSFCSKHLACTETPNIPEGDYNLGLRWLNTAGSETTDEDKRIQIVRPLNPQERNAAFITTMVNWNGLDSKCEKTLCKKQGSGSHKRYGHESR